MDVCGCLSMFMDAYGSWFMVVMLLLLLFRRPSEREDLEGEICAMELSNMSARWE